MLPRSVSFGGGPFYLGALDLYKIKSIGIASLHLAARRMEKGERAYLVGQFNCRRALFSESLQGIL